jgi:mitofilin
MAKRTALIGDQGGSLYLYGLSYLQSLLLIPRSSSDTKYPNKSLETIDVNNLNAIDIVTFARQALEQDDLEQAVKYMNLLSGEPKKQASDWLKSARLHLEVGQLCEALTSYVTAIGAEAIPASGSKN